MTGTVSCSSASMKLQPVAADDDCQVSVNGAKPGQLTTLNVGATLVQVEVKSPDRSQSQVDTSHHYCHAMLYLYIYLLCYCTQSTHTQKKQCTKRKEKKNN